MTAQARPPTAPRGSRAPPPCRSARRTLQEWRIGRERAAAWPERIAAARAAGWELERTPAPSIAWTQGPRQESFASNRPSRGPEREMLPRHPTNSPCFLYYWPGFLAFSGRNGPRPCRTPIEDHAIGAINRWHFSGNVAWRWFRHKRDSNLVADSFGFCESRPGAIRPQNYPQGRIEDGRTRKAPTPCLTDDAARFRKLLHAIGYNCRYPHDLLA